MRKISVWCCGRYLLSFFLRNSYHAVPFVFNDTLVAIWVNPQFYCITVYCSPISIFSALLQFKSIKPIFNNTELRVMLPYSTRWRYCQCEPLLTVQVEFSFYSWAAQCAQSLMLNWRFSVVENNIVVSPDHEAVAMLGRLLSGKRKGQKLVNDQDSCVMNLLLPDLSSWKRFLGADSSLLFRCGFHVKCMSSRPLSVCFLFRTSGKHSQAGSTNEQLT